MSLHLHGVGWISPAARGTSALIATLRGQIEPLDHPNHFIEASASLFPECRNLPRLRRSGRISQLALAAVLDAIADSGKEWTLEQAGRTALIFVSTHGGICHTIRFFESVSAAGTHAGSPLLFPETVYNAPPSHIAAHLGIDGMVSSFVGDSSAIGAALCTAEEWVEWGMCEQCILVAAEEIHPLLQDACHALRLGPGRFGGAPLSEGAAAVILSREPRGSSVRAHPGATIAKRSCLLSVIRRVLEETLENKIPGAVIASSSSAWLETTERAIIAELWPGLIPLFPKHQLGESFAASSLGAIVVGEALLRSNKIPTVLISLLGWNGQTSAVLLTPSSEGLNPIPSL